MFMEELLDIIYRAAVLIQQDSSSLPASHRRASDASTLLSVDAMNEPALFLARVNISGSWSEREHCPNEMLIQV